MRAFHPLFLLLNSWTCLVMGRLPYVRSSGYYSPFPPKDNEGVTSYAFAPLEDVKSRATRDLAWREFTSFLNGDEEPNCADLRRMWRLARQLQQKAIDSNEIPQEMHPFESAFTKEQPTDHQSAQSAQERGAFSSSEVEAPDEQPHRQSSTKQNRDSAQPRDGEGSHVYGVVKTHAPQVRDPTKEILSGLLRSRGSGGSSLRPFGRVHEHTRPEDEPSPSQMDVLQRELYGRPRAPYEPEKESFGTVHRFSPGAQPLTPFDAVRSILAREEGQAVNEESKNAFDRIREKLMNTRARDRVRAERQRGFRKKGSKKRRRNAEEIALIKERLLNDYINILPTSNDDGEKKLRRQKNSKNIANQHKQNKTHRKNWRIAREKMREQNLLLKKLG